MTKSSLLIIVLTLLGAFILIQMVEISDKQRYLQNLVQKESELDNEIADKKAILEEITSEEYRILQAMKKGYGFKNDRRFEEK